MSQAVGVDAQQIIDDAGSLIGVVGQGQSLSGADVQKMFNFLNMMLGQWSEQKHAVYHSLSTTFTANSKQSYTVGSGGDIDITTPALVESAILHNNGVDFPMRVVRSFSDYNLIRLKTLEAFPRLVFLDTAYPLANLYIWPIPNSAYDITIVTMAPFTEFAQLTDAVTMRPAYQMALVANLAVICAPLFGVQVTPDMQRMATTSIKTVKRNNTQLRVMQVEKTLLNRGHYNVYADRSQ